jgi:uncharacterized protein
MKISGTYELPTNSTTAYRLLTDPDVLVRTVPGLKSLKLIEENVYDAELEIGIAMIKGRYKGSVKMTDAVVGEHYRLIVEGQGPIGFVQTEVLIKLEQVSENQTEVICEGEAQIGGVVAGIGQRMISGVASMLMGQFFNAVRKEASKAANVNN